MNASGPHELNTHYPPRISFGMFLAYATELHCLDNGSITSLIRRLLEVQALQFCASLPREHRQQ